MRILVLGAGGIGGYFGGRLAKAGVDVEFLVRPARADTLARNGLTIISPFGNLTTPVQTRTEAGPPADAVLLACKAYDLQNAMDTIAPAVGPLTLVVPLMNGVRHLDALDARFGQACVLGGLCHIGVTLNSTGEVLQLNNLQRFVLGARTLQQREAAEALHIVIMRGGFEPILSGVIVQEMWEKFTFLATYAGMTTLTRAPIGAILAAHDGEAITREMLNECIATATANGHAPRPEAMAQMVSSLSERGSTGAASMLRDMARNGPTEHEHIMGDMLDRAQAAGIAAPLLRISLANMQAYEALRAPAAA